MPNVVGFKINGTAYEYDHDHLANIPTIDSTPTENSTNAVQSGGVYDALSDLKEDFDSNIAFDADGLNETVGSKVTYDTTDIFYAIRQVTGTGSIVENVNGTRIRVVFYIPDASKIKIKARCTYGKGLVIGLFSTLDYAIFSSSSVATAMLQSTYTTEQVSGYFSQGGFISISLCKSDSSAFSDDEKAEAISALDVSIEYYATPLDTDKKDLYIGDLVNMHLTGSALTEDGYAPYRLSSADLVAFPWGSIGKDITVNINPNYRIAIQSGTHANSLGTTSGWVTNGAVVTIPESNNYYRVTICRDVGGTSYTTVEMTADDVDKLNLHLQYEDEYVSNYAEEEKRLNASRLSFYSSDPNTISNMPVIAHTSDCHGDYQRVQNFLDFCDAIGVDCACITGDIVSHNNRHGLGWFADMINNAESLPAICVGNHDAYDSNFTDVEVYNYLFAPIATKIGNATGKNWYYTDITDKSLRIISVDLYEYGGATRNYTHFSETQLAWLCETLASTPADYGILLLYHSPQQATVSSAGYTDFYQTVRKANNTYNAVSGSPITDIVDAFIGRTTISKTYTQTGSPSSVSVSADFSNVDNSVEFVAHLTGHFHQDSVYYISDTTYTQLMLNVNCTNALYGGTIYPYLNDVSDLPRRGVDASQDSFNVYVIDRDAKKVKVVKVGQDITYEMTERKYMAIPYAD